MSKINKEGVVKAICDLYIALGTTPPEEVLHNMVGLLDSKEAQIAMDKITQEMQNQYVEIGKQLKCSLDEAVRHNLKAQDATAQTS